MVGAVSGVVSERTIGAFTLRSLSRTVEVHGETSSGVQSTGVGSHFEVLSSDGLCLTIRDTRWATGERDIVACERHDSPERYDTLVGRLRLSVLDRGGLYVDLRQARLRLNGRAQLFNADLPYLSAGAGVDVEAVLTANGASAIGTREELLADSGSTRRRIAARVGHDGREWAPVVAYVLTRIAPVGAGLAA